MPASSASLESFVRRLPKVELHLHLEGSVSPETLRELARAKGRLEEQTEVWIEQQSRRLFRYGSLPEFLQVFKLVTLLLETPEDYALATRRLVERLAAERVRYAEITLSAGVILWKRQSVPAVFDAIRAAAEESRERHGVRVNWIFDAIRQFGADHAREVLGWATTFSNDGVAAFGIGGDETKAPAHWFKEVYQEAQAAGLHCTAHAGEMGGPEGVREAVELLGAERIGHGLAAARDTKLMEMLRRRVIPLEVCLTSNVATGLVSSVADHPLGCFLAMGLPVTINSDDPALFNTSLEQELLLAGRTFHLSADDLTGLLKNAIRASFLPEPEKTGLLTELVTAATSS